MMASDPRSQMRLSKCFICIEYNNYILVWRMHSYKVYWVHVCMLCIMLHTFQEIFTLVFPSLYEYEYLMAKPYTIEVMDHTSRLIWVLRPSHTMQHFHATCLFNMFCTTRIMCHATKTISWKCCMQQQFVWPTCIMQHKIFLQTCFYNKKFCCMGYVIGKNLIQLCCACQTISTCTTFVVQQLWNNAEVCSHVVIELQHENKII